MAIWLAAPGVTVIEDDGIAVSCGAENDSVRAPIVPVMTTFVNVATPLASVVAVVVPLSDPPPVAIAAVTTTPACAMGLFVASLT